MEKYGNINGNSNVEGCEIGPDYIRVKFLKTNKTYTYSYRKAGNNHVDNMKKLAKSGSGLNSYINLNVKKLYD